MQLTQEDGILLGAVISIAISLIIIGVVIRRDLQALEKRIEDKKPDDDLLNFFDDRDAPLEIWVEAIRFGSLVGVTLFLIFTFISCSVLDI